MGRDVARTLALRLLALGLTFGASIVTARLLGPTLRGDLAVMIALPSLIAATSLMGGDSANLALAGRSADAHASIVRISLLHAAAVGLLVTVPLVALGIVWEPVRLGLEPAAFQVALVLTPFLVLVMLLGAAEAGRRRATLVAWLTVAAAATWLLGAIAAAILGIGEPAGVFLIFLAAQLVLTGGLLGVAWPGTIRTRAISVGEYVAFALRANLSTVALLILLRIDVPLIQVMAGPAQVGLYSIAVPIAESLLLLSTVVSLVLVPASAAGDVDHGRAVTIARLSLLAAAAVGVALAVLAPVGIPLVFGERFAGSVPILWALLPGLILFTAGRTLQAHLLANQVFAATTYGAALGLVAMVGMSLVLVPPLGAFGGAVAASASYLVFAVTQAWAVTRMSGTSWVVPFLFPAPSAVRTALAAIRRPGP